MLPADTARRLVAELQGALDACAERQRQLDRSLSISRRLLQAWEPAGTLAPEPSPRPENKEEDLTSAYTPSTQDLKELELLTQALEKAVRIRKGISKTGERDRTPRLKSRPISVSSGATASVPPQASSRAGSRASGARPTKGIHQSRVLDKDQPEHRFLSVGDSSHMAIEAQATSCGPGLRHEQMVQSAAPQMAETFTLKEKGTLLQLPVNFRKVASQNSRLWAQLNSTQTSDSTDATSTAKAQFLQKLQGTSGWPGPRLSAMEIEVEAQRLRKACVLLRLRMQQELSSAPADWMQEYSCLLILEGLQAIVGQYLQRLQVLRAAVREQLPGPCLVERPPQASSPCGGGVDPSWSPQLLLYSSTQELQTLATLKLRVAMLDQQIHLEKVLMAELLPLVSTQEPQGLALYRAVHSLLCEGGERFLTILRDDPAY
ncbi:tubulin epsilon and delta complex protein 2 [Sciurus carolinensis]|uniref:tubulin epsilon and delta complex protein 2 n=1 Tax=Sciurus carolinensis TaxID=30640 RepID=UPI001FB40E24|nr:tubulin epsilon and delta complex protein 2 [Sciurus carolinensis]